MADWGRAFYALLLAVGNTLLVTLSCSAAGLLYGAAIAFLRRITRFEPLIFLLDFVNYVLRGIPIAPFLFLIYFGAPRFGILLNPYFAMIFSLGLMCGAYLSEIFRGALESVDSQEIAAALSCGMSRPQVFWHIEFPQALRFSAPSVLNELTAVLKYSPFAYTVGIPEITKFASNLNAVVLRGTEIYLAMGVVYFLLYQILSRSVSWLVNRARVPGIGDHFVSHS